MCARPLQDSMAARPSSTRSATARPGRRGAARPHRRPAVGSRRRAAECTSGASTYAPMANAPHNIRATLMISRRKWAARSGWPRSRSPARVFGGSHRSQAGPSWWACSASMLLGAAAAAHVPRSPDPLIRRPHRSRSALACPARRSCARPPQRTIGPRSSDPRARDLAEPVGARSVRRRSDEVASGRGPDAGSAGAQAARSDPDRRPAAGAAGRTVARKLPAPRHRPCRRARPARRSGSPRGALRRPDDRSVVAFAKDAAGRYVYANPYLLASLGDRLGTGTARRTRRSGRPMSRPGSGRPTGP